MCDVEQQNMRIIGIVGLVVVVGLIVFFQNNGGLTLSEEDSENMAGEAYQFRGEVADIKTIDKGGYTYSCTCTSRRYCNDPPCDDTCELSEQGNSVFCNPGAESYCTGCSMGVTKN